MNRQKEFLEFVTKNPPPCLPGDKLFWLDQETGEIKQDTTGITSIVLDENWEWKIIDDSDEELVTPNKTPYFCITAEDAKKFRDEVECVKYVVFKPDAEGNVVIDDNSFSVLKVATLNDIESLRWYEDYIVAILNKDKDVELGMAIRFERSCYLLTSKGKVDEAFISSMDKESKRILEDVFEDV